MDAPSNDPTPAPPLLGYATPTPLADAGIILRDGTHLIVRDKTTLPPHCILCGRPAAGEAISLKFTWDASFQITPRRSTLELRRQGAIRAFLCPSHRRRWAAGRILGFSGIAASLTLMLAGAVLAAISESATDPAYSPLGIAMMIAGFAAMIVSLFTFTLLTRTLSCKNIEAGYLTLEGAAEPFLAPLPQAPKSQ